jgi:predicted dehydrogenase
MLRVGIVGGGQIAEAVHIPTYNAIEGVQIIALAEPHESRRRALKKSFDIPNGYADVTEMLEREILDVLSICTPPNTHEDIFTTGAAHDVAIYCEKPTADSIESVERMTAAANERDIVSQIGYKHRHLDNMIRVFDMIENGLLSDLLDIQVQFYTRGSVDDWRVDPEVAGGGVLMDLFPHVLDVCLEIFDEEPAIEGVDVRSIGPWDVDDFANIRLQFGSTTVTLKTVFTQSADYRIRYFFTGKHGWLEMNDEAKLRGSVRDSDVYYKNGELPLFDVEVGRLLGRTSEDAYERSFRQFVRAVESGDTNEIPTIERGLNVMKTVDRLYGLSNQ